MSKADAHARAAAPSITLTGLFVYPVKSARGIPLQQATLGDRGLVHDRRFMVVDDKGRFLTQRELPRMARLETAVHEAEGELRLAFEGQPLSLPLQPVRGSACRVRVFQDEVDALDLGADARAFLTAALGRTASLVYMPEPTRRQVDPSRAGAQDIVGFADAFPFLLAAESSLAALNRELDEPVTMERFRPNFIIEGVPAYSEDEFHALTIGGVPFVALKPSARCVIVNTNPRTGAREKGVLEALVRTHSLGNRPIFGQNLVARGTGSLTVGDAVDITPPA